MLRSGRCTGCLDTPQGKALCLWVDVVTRPQLTVSNKSWHLSKKVLQRNHISQALCGSETFTEVDTVFLLVAPKSLIPTKPLYLASSHLSCPVLRVLQSQNLQGETQLLVAFESCQ